MKNYLGFLQWIYKDNGFAEVQVSKPHQVLDPDRRYVRLTYIVEEGIQYNVGTIDLSGDLLFPKDEMIKLMKLKSNALFRYGYFTRDIEMMTDKYGDLGYAYTDINPIVTFDKEKKLANINYEIAKGDKIYFGDMTIIGNSKTRDNVMRRDYPALAAALFDPIATDRRGDEAPGQKPYFEIPVFTWHAQMMSTIYQRQYIDSAQRFEDAMRLTPLHVEALDCFDALANDSQLNFLMRLEPGDMQFVHNHTLLHDRTAFDDWPEAGRQRHLLRLWLSSPQARPLPAIWAERYGSVEPGVRGGVSVPAASWIAPLSPE